MNLSRAWFVQLKEGFVLYSGYKSVFYYIITFVHIWPFAAFNTGKKIMGGEGAVDYFLLFMQVISVAFISL